MSGRTHRVYDRMLAPAWPVGLSGGPRCWVFVGFGDALGEFAELEVRFRVSHGRPVCARSTALARRSWHVMLRRGGILDKVFDWPSKSAIAIAARPLGVV